MPRNIVDANMRLYGVFSCNCWRLFVSTFANVVLSNKSKADTQKKVYIYLKSEIRQMLLRCW